jgi:N-acetylglucosamine-6-phosphate deacetylase
MNRRNTAFGKGRGRATHLFNAMSPFQGRAPGMVGAIYDAAPFASIIADGVHCDFASVRISHKLLGNKLFLITDAVTESDRGDYRFRFAGDRYVDADGTLSGSSLTMWQAVRNCTQKAGIPLDESLRMASLYPARAAGLADKTGMLATGYPAKWIAFDEKLELAGEHCRLSNLFRILLPLAKTG